VTSLTPHSDLLYITLSLPPLSPSPPSPINYQPYRHRLVSLYCRSDRTSRLLSLAEKDDVRAMALQVSVTSERSLCSSVFHHTSQARCALLRVVHHQTLHQAALLLVLRVLFQAKLHAVRLCAAFVFEQCSCWQLFLHSIFLSPTITRLLVRGAAFVS
jgi:hypothetical protein